MFVGGTVTALYTLAEGVDVRPTVDVDCVVDVATTAEYYEYVDRLGARGFKPCTDDGAPLCRLVRDGVRVDFVATANIGHGPTNRWYRDAVADATPYADGMEVLAITPLYFVATKLEAFRGRGRGDYQSSHDLEDVFAVIGGLPELREQITFDATRVAIAVRRELVDLFAKPAFVDAVPGHFEGHAPGQARASSTLDWLMSLARREAGVEGG